MKIKNILMILAAALAFTAFSACDDDKLPYQFKENVTVDIDNIEVDPGGSGVATIKSGNGNYTVRSTDPSIATATMVGNEISVLGVASGKASIIITDDKGVNGLVNVLVYSDFTIGSPHLDMLTNRTENISIVSGNGGYRFEYTEPNIDLGIVEDPLRGSMIAVTSNDVEIANALVTVYDRTGRSASFTVTVVDPFTVIKNDNTPRMEYKTYRREVADEGTNPNGYGVINFYNDNTTYSGYQRFGWRENHNYRMIEIRIPTTQNLTTLGLKTGGQIKYDFDNYNAGDGYISWSNLKSCEVIKYDAPRVWIVFEYTKTGTGAGTWQGIVCMDI